MRVAILSVGGDRQAAIAFTKEVYDNLPGCITPADRVRPSISVTCTDVVTMNAALKLGMIPLPEEFNQADHRLIVAADDVANTYLRSLKTALEQARQRAQATAKQLPCILVPGKEMSARQPALKKVYLGAIKEWTIATLSTNTPPPLP